MHMKHRAGRQGCTAVIRLCKVTVFILAIGTTRLDSPYSPEVIRETLCGPRDSPPTKLSCSENRVIVIVSIAAKITSTASCQDANPETDSGAEARATDFVWQDIQGVCSYKRNCAFVFNVELEERLKYMYTPPENSGRVYLHLKHICVSPTVKGPECRFEEDPLGKGYTGSWSMNGNCVTWNRITMTRHELLSVEGSENYCRTRRVGDTLVCPMEVNGLIDLHTCDGDKIPLCKQPGNWGEWTESSCVGQCGTGKLSKRRQCNDPAPTLGGKYCQGSSNVTQLCQMPPCPIQGGWSSWGNYSTCSKTCGPGVKTRERTCTNPKPAHGGKHCLGDSQENIVCSTPCALLAGDEPEVIRFLKKYGVWIGVGAAVLLICIILLIWYHKTKTKQLVVIPIDTTDDGKPNLEALNYKYEVLKKTVNAAETSACPDKTSVKFALNAYEESCKRSTAVPDDELLIRAKAIVDVKDETTEQLNHDLDLLKMNLVNANTNLDETEIKHALSNYNEFVDKHKSCLGVQRNKDLIDESEFNLVNLNRKSALLKAIETKSARRLNKIITNVEKSGAATWLKEELETAKKTQESLLHVDKLKMTLLAINREEINKIADFEEPSHQVHDAVVAALLILGEHEDKTEYDWEMCQKIITAGILKRVRKFKFKYLHSDLATRALDILEHVAQKPLEDECSAVASLYLWTVGTCAECLKLSPDISAPATGDRQQELLDEMLRNCELDEENDKARKEMKEVERDSKMSVRKKSEYYTSGSGYDTSISPCTSDERLPAVEEV